MLDEILDSMGYDSSYSSVPDVAIDLFFPLIGMTKAHIRSLRMSEFDKIHMRNLTKDLNPVIEEEEINKIEASYTWREFYRFSYDMFAGISNIFVICLLDKY